MEVVLEVNQLVVLIVVLKIGWPKGRPVIVVVKVISFRFGEFLDLFLSLIIFPLASRPAGNH